MKIASAFIFNNSQKKCFELGWSNKHDQFSNKFFRIWATRVIWISHPSFHHWSIHFSRSFRTHMSLNKIYIERKTKLQGPTNIWKQAIYFLQLLLPMCIAVHNKTDAINFNQVSILWCYIPLKYISGFHYSIEKFYQVLFDIVIMIKRVLWKWSILIFYHQSTQLFASNKSSPNFQHMNRTDRH